MERKTLLPESIKKIAQGICVATENDLSFKTFFERIQSDWNDFSPINLITHAIENEGSVAQGESGLLISKKNSKVIYQIASLFDIKRLEPYVDLMSLRLGRISPLLKARGTSVSSIAFNNGKLWITIQAGYSSSIIAISDKSKKMVKDLYTRGPEPTGIAFEPKGNRGWVLDGSTKELNQFTVEGSWTKKAYKLPLEKPVSLAIDSEGNFLTFEAAKREIFLFRRQN